jgi:L-alanine-DL-glutamate epimerase-like enolase superfamily enzyme
LPPISIEADIGQGTVDSPCPGEFPTAAIARRIAVGSLDMAIWGAAAKIVDLPLYAFVAGKVCRRSCLPSRIPVYASGGYLHANRDIKYLRDEMMRFIDLGFTHAKIKIGRGRPHGRPAKSGSCVNDSRI